MAPMLQHLVYQHPGLSVQPTPLHQQQQLSQQPSGVAVSLTHAAHRHTTAADLSPKSSHSGDTPMSGGHPGDLHSPSLSRNNEAQSWTFEEQFRQVSDIMYYLYNIIFIRSLSWRVVTFFETRVSIFAFIIFLF